MPVWAVVFAVTRVNTVVSQVTGTRTELVQLIEPVLVKAGWTTISGTGTGDVVMQSADPAGAVPAIQVRIFDTATNTVSVSFRNLAASQISNTLFILPAAAKDWRIIANEYQLFIFSAASATPVARNYVSGGIPAMALGMVPSPVWWGVGDGGSDTDTTTRETFRLGVSTHGSGCNVATNSGQQACNYNGTLLDGNSVSGNATGPLTLMSPYSATSANVTVNQYNLFADGSAMVSDAYLGWGIAGVILTSPLRYVGTIYDAIIVGAVSAYDTTITFNGNNYWVVSSQTLGNSCNPGALALRVP
jgi:hypothetical protein